MVINNINNMLACRAFTKTIKFSTQCWNVKPETWNLETKTLYSNLALSHMSLASGGHLVTEVTALPQRRQRLSEQVNISFGNLDFGGNI